MTKERTPAGGDSSDIIFLNADGKPVTDPKDAVEAEIREYADGVMIHRTYMEIDDPSKLPQWTDPGQAGTEPDVVDFSKNTWDVYVNQAGRLKLVETVDELLAALGKSHLPEAGQRELLARLAKLPSWRAAPKKLKNEAAALLPGTDGDEAAT